MAKRHFYDNEPHAAPKALADKPLTPKPSVGSNAPKMVPASPGKMSGLSGTGGSGRAPRSQFHHGLGSRRSHGISKLRLSGSRKAHRIGSR